MVNKLELYILNSDNSVTPFPSEAEQIVLYDFTYEAQRMGGAPTILSKIKANSDIEAKLTARVFCEYNNERYFLKIHPSSSKDNNDIRNSFELTFVSERTILDNVYMIDAVRGDTSIDQYQSNSSKIVFMGDINEFISRLNSAMDYTGVGYSVVVDSGISSIAKEISFENKMLTEALQECAQAYNIPYYFEGKEIHFGWAKCDIPTVKYMEGLVSINKSVRNNRIINRATGVGSSDNIPHYYPNPTPRGIIKYTVPQGVAVNNERLLALMPVDDSLVYIPETREIKSLGTFGFNLVTDRQPDLLKITTSTLILGQMEDESDQIICGPVILLKSSFPDKQSFDVNLTVRHSDDAWSQVMYASESNNTYPQVCILVDGILVEDLSVNVQYLGVNTVELDGAENQSTFSLHIDNFPPDEERYLYFRFYNTAKFPKNYIFPFQWNVFADSIEQGWHIQDDKSNINTEVVNVQDYGLGVDSTFTSGSVSYEVVGKIPFASALMPPVYRDSGGVERFYNAKNGVYEGIEFENEYSPENPSEYIATYENIKPTIVGVTNAADEYIDTFKEFAYDLKDNDGTVLSDGGSEEYEHPYFFAKMPRLDGPYGFNLFAQALESGDMYVSMTSGVCGACKFTIMVDKNTHRNLVMVDDSGDLLRDANGNVIFATDARGLDSQNDTINNEVWIALKKDISTFGQIMPNVGYKHYPSAGDTFVLINILMPDGYIKKAEVELKDAILSDLVAFNTFSFDFSVDFSRIYLHDNNSVSSALSENARLNFEYNGDLYSRYISSYTYRSAASDILPQISVELVEDIRPATSNFSTAINSIASIQKAVEEISKRQDSENKYLKSNEADVARGKITFDDGLDFAKKLASKDFKQGEINGEGFGVFKDGQGQTVIEVDKLIARRGSYDPSSVYVIREDDATIPSDANVFSALRSKKEFLSRLHDDVVEGKIAFKDDIFSEGFISGLTGGKGWAIQQKETTNAAGAVEKRSTLEIDDVVVRGVLRVFEFVVSQMLGENDNRTFTGMMEIDHYDPSDSKIYLKTQSGKLYNPFRADDILVVQQYNPASSDGYITKQYELVITEVGMGDMADGVERLDWVKFNNFTTTMDGDASTLITEGDTLVRLDNLTDDQRKGIIQIMSVGEATPYMDVIYGAKTDPDNALKVRIGNLAGIYNALFGNLYGFGAFLSNFYGVGEFRIQHTGEDVASKLEMTSKGFSTNFRKVTYNLPESDNYLDNPSFLDNMANWDAGESGVNFFVTAQNEPIYLNRNLYAESEHFVGLDEYNGRDLLRITDSQIMQKNANIKKPTFHKEYDPEYVEGESGTEADGNTETDGNTVAKGYTEVADTMYLTIKFYCTKGGSLDVGFVDDAGEPISVESENAISYYPTEVTASIDEQTYEAIGIWEGEGNFIIKTDGEVFIESVALSTRPLDNYKTETSTSIEQTAHSIALVGQKIDTVSDETTNLRAEVNTATESINLLAERTDGIESSVGELKVSADGLSSAVATVQGDVEDAKTNAQTALSNAQAATNTADSAKRIANSAKNDAATALSQSENAITLYAANFNDNGTVKAEGHLAVFVDGEVSNIQLTADNVNINGIVKVEGSNDVTIGGFEVTADSLTNTDLGSYIRISGGAGLTGHWVAINDPKGKGAIDIYSNHSIGINVGTEQAGTARIAIKAIGNTSLLGRYANDESGEEITVKGLALGYKTSSNTFKDSEGYWADFIVATSGGKITLPNPNYCAGKILFVKGNGTNTYTVSGGGNIMKPNEYSSVTSLSISGGRSMFFIATNSMWYAFSCFYL